MPYDYAHTDDGDLMIENGDLKVVESTLQHQSDLLITNKGAQRIYPFVGVGITDFINDDHFGLAYNEIKEQFELDGMSISKIELYSNGAAEIEAEY